MRGPAELARFVIRLDREHPGPAIDLLVDRVTGGIAAYTSQRGAGGGASCATFEASVAASIQY
jgi:hypothetical protein